MAATSTWFYSRRGWESAVAGGLPRPTSPRPRKQSPHGGARRLSRCAPCAASSTGTATRSALYEALKTAELEAERVAQGRLEALAPPKVKPDAPCRDDALANLALYLGSGTAYDVATPLILALAEIDAKID